MLQVKICGITRLEDVLVLIQYPVWALGFIQVETSPRYVKPDLAKKLISYLPNRILSIGVFQDHSIQTIKQIRDYCGFSMVQLHGNEEPTFCAQLGRGIIRAFRIGQTIDWIQLGYYQSVTDYFLFDTFVDGKNGGTGQPFSWKLLKGIERFGKPFLVSGGLSPDNISKCLGTIAPFGIDVNSGVESSPGKKDSRKVQALFQKLNPA
ncbi:MAG: phosphoribosylanthranilate isomerase [Candidatus Atribacteria bacterium]|nr:phosphoribosylanthranilate isomerase [Candidatus Atribacteria bacterium]